MSFEEIRYVAIVYASSIIPILILIKYRSVLPKWVPAYLSRFFYCVCSWLGDMVHLWINKWRISY
jgi:hypothetical protein